MAKQTTHDVSIDTFDILASDTFAEALCDRRSVWLWSHRTIRDGACVRQAISSRDTPVIV
jgi:hypothetical protein